MSRCTSTLPNECVHPKKPVHYQPFNTLRLMFQMLLRFDHTQPEKQMSVAFLKISASCRHQLSVEGNKRVWLSIMGGGGCSLHHLYLQSLFSVNNNEKGVCCFESFRGARWRVLCPSFPLVLVMCLGIFSVKKVTKHISLYAEVSL